MKRIKKYIVISIIIGVFLFLTFSFCLAETLIQSKNVSYTDTKNLAADNVQDAIDGTCDKMNSKLTQVDNKLLEVDKKILDIEDKMYTAKKISETNSVTTATEWFYTGISITFPANSYCAISMGNGWANNKPVGLRLTATKESSSTGVPAHGFVYGDGNIYLTHSDYFETETTYYVWVKYETTGLHDVISYSGFCATKYKQ